MSDEHSLSSRLASDLDGHFEELVRTFQDRLYGFALRLTASPQDAEESTQDTFVRAYRAMQRYPAARVAALRLRPWLYRIALNVVRTRLRGAPSPQVAIDGPVGDTLASHAREEQPEAANLGAESLDTLARVIADLPERHATGEILRHVHGLAYTEAAEVLGQPVGTTKSDVHRGLRLLRAALEPELQLIGEDSKP